jgi:hypothetical protein
VARAVTRPPRAALALLRACLATRDDPRPDAWAELGDPIAVLRIDAVRQAGLMAQLLHAATLAGVALDPGVRSRLRAARVHEDLRLAATAPACRAAIGDDTIVLRGVAFAYTIYDEPALRHCHDLDLLVGDGAGTAAPEGSFPVSRHRSLLGRVAVGVADVDTVDAMVAGVPARVLAPADALVHACAHAVTRGVPGSPLWPLDAALLVRGTPGLDWDRVARRAVAWRCAGDVGSALDWLRRVLGVPVAPSLARELRVRGLRALPGDGLRRGWAHIVR